MAKAKQGKKPAMSKAERRAWEKKAQVNAANIKLAADASACARDDYTAICKAENTAKVRFERIILSEHPAHWVNEYLCEFLDNLEKDALKSVNGGWTAQHVYNRRSQVKAVCTAANLYRDMPKAEQTQFAKAMGEQSGFHGFISMVRDVVRESTGKARNVVKIKALSDRAVKRVVSAIRRATDEQIAKLLASVQAEANRRAEATKGRKAIEKTRLIREATGATGPRNAKHARNALVKAGDVEMRKVA